MKKVLLLLFLFVIIYSCGPSRALVMESADLADYKFNGEKVLVIGDKCKEAENIIKNCFKKLGMTIVEKEQDGPKYKCVVECKSTYTNSLEGIKVISKLDMISKIYTFNDDKILYTIQMNDENYLGVDLKIFEADYYKDMIKSIK